MVMLVFQLVNFRHVFVLLLLEVLLPLHVEFLKRLLTNFNVVFELVLLNVRAQLVLICHDFSFEESYLSHQIFIKLVLEDLAALVRQQLHLFLDDREQQNLLVFVEDAVPTLVEHFDELIGALEPQQVEDVSLALFEDQADVGLVEKPLLAEVSLPNRIPDLFALTCAADHASRLLA